MSGLPQMSEIPMEERVPYAYRQQIKLQQKINGYQPSLTPNEYHDELIMNTPT